MPGPPTTNRREGQGSPTRTSFSAVFCVSRSESWDPARIGQNMTKNRRAKQDARARLAATGESYTAARRRTSKKRPADTIVRHFVADCCANCLQPLPPQVPGLFCGELCQQTADTIRYWRRVTRDGRIEQPDVQLALKTRVAHLLAGGYARRSRRLPDTVRTQVWDRDQGRCRECGGTGAEVDHVAGDSPDLNNLQLLCTPCHHRKTETRMAPASRMHLVFIKGLELDRVSPDEPRLLCDDQDQWATEQQRLRTERRGRLLDQLAEYGYQRRDFPGYTWVSALT